MNSAPSPDSPKPKHCPDCGAELQPGATWCWLCNYAPPLPRPGAVAETPQKKPDWVALIAIVVLAIAFVPACMVAFFVSCLGLVLLDAEGIVPVQDDLGSGMLMGCVGAMVVGVLLIVVMVQLFRSYRRSTLPPEIRND